MRAAEFFAVVASALIAVEADAAEITIANQSGQTMRVSLRCRTHGGWADMTANRDKAVILHNQREIPLSQHGGSFRIVAVTNSNVQFTSGWETMSDDRPNRFTISPTFGAPANGPGGGGIVITRRPDLDDEEEEEVPQTTTSRAGLGAPNLGITYERVPYTNGTFGARLTRDPAPGSAAAQLRLEPGDVIFELDGQRFTRPEDMLNHRFQTTMRFIDVRTNLVKSAVVNLP